MNWQWHLHSLFAMQWPCALPIKHVLEKKIPAWARDAAALVQFEQSIFYEDHRGAHYPPKVGATVVLSHVSWKVYAEPSLWRAEVTLKVLLHAFPSSAKASYSPDGSYKAGGNQFHLMMGTPNVTALVTTEIKVSVLHFKSTSCHNKHWARSKALPHKTLISTCLRMWKDTGSISCPFCFPDLTDVTGRWILTDSLYTLICTMKILPSLESSYSILHLDLRLEI